MATANKNTWLYIITALLLTANVVTLTLLWINKPGHHQEQSDRHPPRQSLFEYLSRELKLDQKQQDAYSLLRNEHQRSTRELQDSTRSAKDKLFTMLQQPSVSEEMITALSNEAASFQTQLDVITFHHFQKVRALCNPDQQKKFDAIIQEALRVHAPGNPPPRRDGP